jgi:hypothetical protein
MKQMAGRDIEDILQVCPFSTIFRAGPIHWNQCSIPVFDGLFPGEHNNNILRLLYVSLQWHSLAKLRMHTEDTLRLLDDATTALGHQLREFSQKTCPAFDTRELKQEAQARIRRESKKAMSQSRTTELPNAKKSSNASRRLKTFNLATYKIHALGDYAATIRRFGTTDSYTTETVRAALILEFPD